MSEGSSSSSAVAETTHATERREPRSSLFALLSRRRRHHDRHLDDDVTHHTTTTTDEPIKRLFRYSVANVHAAGDHSTIEQLLSEDRLRDREAVSRRRKSAHPPAFHHYVPKTALSRVFLTLEIVSATGFDADWLYCEYQLLLPADWVPAHEERYKWDTNEEGHWYLIGSTQIARSTDAYPLVVHSGWRGMPILGVDQNTILIGTIAFAGLVVSMVVRQEFVFWLCIGLILLSTTNELTMDDGTDECTDGVTSFGLPICVNILLPLDQSNTSFRDVPQLFFQVSSTHSWHRDCIQGYGSLRLGSSTAQLMDREVTTWRYYGGSWSDLREWFIGGTGRFSDLRFISNPPTTAKIPGVQPGQRKFLSKLSFVTKTSGKLRIRSSAIDQRKPEKYSGFSKRNALRDPFVDKILHMYSVNNDSSFLDMTNNSTTNSGAGVTVKRATKILQQLKDKRDRFHSEMDTRGRATSQLELR